MAKSNGRIGPHLELPDNEQQNRIREAMEARAHNMAVGAFRSLVAKTTAELVAAGVASGQVKFNAPAEQLELVVDQASALARMVVVRSNRVSFLTEEEARTAESESAPPAPQEG